LCGWRLTPTPFFMNIIKPILSYFNHNWGENLNIQLVPINPLHGDKLNKFILLYIDNTYGENITISNRRVYNVHSFSVERASKEYDCNGKFFCRIEKNSIYFGENLKTIVSLFNMEYGDAHFLLTDWFIHKSKTMDTPHWEEIDRLIHNRNVQKMISIPTPYEKHQNLLNIIPS
jgi:hypothetical protein